MFNDPKCTLSDGLVAYEDAVTWKRGRKTMHQFFAAEQLQQHLHFQQAEASQLLNDLLDDPTVCPSSYIQPRIILRYTF